MQALPPPSVIAQGMVMTTTPPGTVITLEATAQVPGGELVTAHCELIVIKPGAGWPKCVRCITGYDKLADGLMVEREVDGKLVRGVQERDGGLFGVEK